MLNPVGPPCSYRYSDNFLSCAEDGEILVNTFSQPFDSFQNNRRRHGIRRKTDWKVVIILLCTMCNVCEMRCGWRSRIVNGGFCSGMIAIAAADCVANSTNFTLSDRFGEARKISGRTGERSNFIWDTLCGSHVCIAQKKAKKLNHWSVFELIQPQKCWILYDNNVTKTCIRSNVWILFLYHKLESDIFPACISARVYCVCDLSNAELANLPSYVALRYSLLNDLTLHHHILDLTQDAVEVLSVSQTFPFWIETVGTFRAFRRRVVGYLRFSRGYAHSPVLCWLTLVRSIIIYSCLIGLLPYFHFCYLANNPAGTKLIYGVH